MPKTDKKKQKQPKAPLDVDDTQSSASEHDGETSEHREDETNEQSKDQSKDETSDEIITSTPFSTLNLHPSLLSSIASLKWTNATQIQAASIPPALEGRDVIGLAETGSGKTGSFAIPILNYLLDKPQKAVFAVILAPTRELAFQIHEVMVALGRGMGAQSVCVVGGVDMASQAIALARNPHVVVATVSFTSSLQLSCAQRTHITIQFCTCTTAWKAP